MSDATIRAAFETRVSAWAAAQVPPIPVAYENVPFKPPKERYVRCHMIPAPAESQTLNGEHRRRMGVFQVSLYMPIGGGYGEAYELAASLDAALPMSQPMSQDGLNVFILSPMAPGPALETPDRYYVPVSCSYRADIII